MAVFEHCSMLLEMKTLPFKEKKKLKSSVTENGGRICYAVNKQCTLIVTSDVSELSANRLRGIQRHQTPVVGPDYVYSCLERGLLLPVEDYRLEASSSPPLPPSSLTRQVFQVAAADPVDSVGPSQRAKGGAVREESRISSGLNPELPTYPENFQVAKYSVFQKMSSNTWYVLELQSCRGEAGRRYRVAKYWKDIRSTTAAAATTQVILSTSEEALQEYKAQRESLRAMGLTPRTGSAPQTQHLGSAPFQQLLLEEKLHAGSLSQEVAVFVELLWTEALGRLGNVLRVPIDQLSLNDVSRVEGLLLEAQRKLKEETLSSVSSLLGEVYTLLPHIEPLRDAPTAKLLSQKLDLCQLIRDVLSVSEMTLSSSAPSSLGKYRALSCSVEAVAPDAPEFQDVTALLQDRRVQVRRVLRVGREAELQTFRSEVGNVKPLLHSSSPSNFVGVLSRGLLLPRVGVEHHGIERTDVGHLGSGIYFSDAVSTSLKYSTPSETDGSRLLLVCDVALGRCRAVRQRDATLTQAPEGHHSVHGVRRAHNAHSEFEDDEYVVYSADQVKLKYVVQFSVSGEQVKEFSPTVDTSAQAPPTSDHGRELMQEDDEVESFKNPLADVKAGLMDSAGQQLPLQAVHVKCKLMDLLSQVIIFQKYSNLSSVPIEAKYVFPLDDSAAVCGFEAFINGKHVVGQVKEKEAARREYKQAIEKGHGAYLMDQDAPDVFTISVGNLPPGATVLIKVTFVSELIVRDGSVLFSLPGSVAPWQESAALNQTTQVSVEKVCVTDEAREFSLDVSVEMPNKITELKCITHQVKTKRTDCKAVVSVLPGEVMGQDGFQLSITLSDVHLPRMWVEKHPDKDSQASMLVFYPDFEVDSASAPDEVVLLVDTSESMKGAPLRAARTVARHVLRTLDHNMRLNVIFFGTDHADAFLTARPLAEARPAAESFIKLSPPVGGSTELWRPLRALGLLPPSRGVRNLLLLSDGHVQNAELALRLLRDNARHSRLFTCGLSPTANRHMLRALAQAGGGAYEFFDTKTKHNWAEKVACQLKRMASPGCSSVSVKWQQFDSAAPPPVQAPKQLHALFNDCHALVYGFVPHCTQATLLGNLSGQELKTMVSTSELQKTTGTFLHKLTARAVIRDYEDGSLDSNEAEHECKRKELKRFVIELSKEFSILSRFTSFVAIEERDSEQSGDGFTDIPKLISEEDVDFLPYISWISPQAKEEEEPMDIDMGYCMSDCLDYDECAEEEEEWANLADGDSLNDYDCVQNTTLHKRLNQSVSPRYSPTSSSLEMHTRPVVYSSTLPPRPQFTVSQGLFQPSSLSIHPPPPPPPPPVSQGLFQPSSLSIHPPPPPPPPVSQGLFQPSSLSIHPPPPHSPVSQGLFQPSSLSIHPPPPPPVSQGLFQPSSLSIHPPPPPPPVSQGLFQPSSLSIHPPPPHSPVSQGLFQPSSLSIHPPPPPPRPGGPPFNSLPDFLSLSSPSACRGQVGSAAFPTLHDSMGGIEMDQSDVTSHSRRSSMRMSRDIRMERKENEERETFSSSGYRPMSLTTSSSHSVPTGRTLRAEGSPCRSSGFSFGGSPIQAQSVSRMSGDALDTTQSSQQSAEDLSQRFVLNKKHKLFQSLLVGQDGGAESEQAPVTPVYMSSGFSFGGSQIQAHSASRMSGDALETTQSSRQPAEDLSQRFVLNEQHRKLKSLLVGKGLRAGIATVPATPAGLSFGFGGSQSQAHSASRRSGDASETTQSSRQPAEDLSDCLAMEENTQMSQSLLVGQDRRAESEQARFDPSRLQLRLKAKSLYRRSGDASETTHSSRWSVEDLSDSLVVEEASDERGPPVRPRGRTLRKSCLRSLSTVRHQAQAAASSPEALRLRWTKIFQIQHSEGYWELTTELGELIDFNVDLFANEFLKNKGIQSLGVRAHTDILRLVATLLVLQLMRVQSLKEGKLLRTLFSLDDSPLHRPTRWVELKRAVDWVCWADRQYPCVYSRLEFGLSWETSTRQLLGLQGLPPLSALTGLKLQRADRRLLVF